jgi:hypothetical protein
MKNSTEQIKSFIEFLEQKVVKIGDKEGMKHIEEMRKLVK